ncbi:MAG: type IV pilin protein [Rhodanobacter sp.]
MKMVTTMRTAFAATQQANTVNPEAMPHTPNMHPFRPAQRKLTWRKANGFTLIELMIVVAIVAILAAIAIPAYQKQILQSRRTSAKTALLDLSGREERYYAANNTYDASLSDLGYAATGGALQVPNSSNEDYYSVAIAVTAAAGTTPASYVATAVPVNSQAADATGGCGTYSITDLGVQGNTGTNTGPGGSGCW